MDAKFTFIKTDIKGPIIIEPKVLEDKRGFFTETYNYKEFKKNGIQEIFIQDNYSSSKKNVLRGLHFQREPYGTSKLVQCIEGEIFDVIVDIRPKSKSFGKWIGIVLSEKNKKMLYIPQGFAHGFYVTSKKARIMYKVTQYYFSKYDAGVKWNDPKLSISWPCSRPLVSTKDAGLPFLSEIENNA
jgi:dTDP-4-dehydrorhamnose 3,5-epimerase